MAVKFGHMIVYFLLLVLVTEETIAGTRNMKPRFERKFSLLWKNVPENTHPGYEIADISEYAIDDEGDVLTYDIDERGSRICTIGRRDGKLRLKISPDRETKSTYEFVVNVSDNYKGGINRSTSMDVYLYILDINDNKPVFQNTPYHVKIREDSRVGTEVIKLTAIDLDTGRNKKVRYLMADEHPDVKKFFHLDSSTGTVTVKRQLDYESRNSYNLDVIAQDDGTPSLSSKTRLIIDVSDSGDRKPTFRFNLSDREVNENALIGTPIAHVQATDGDKSINNNIAYVIVSGNERGLFRLNQYTGNLTVSGLLDREQYFMFDLKIKAYEIEQPDSFEVAHLKIRLIDENDNKPEFTQNTYLIELEEDRMFPMTILTDRVKAVDKDATWPYNQMRYWMKPSEYFEILQKSGTIVLKKPLPVKDTGGATSFTVYAIEKNTKENYTATANVSVVVTRKPRVVSAMTIGNSSIKICSSFQIVLLLLTSSILHNLLYS